MKPKLRYNRNYTVTLITESKQRKLETWSTVAALTALAIAALALLAGPEPQTLAETDSVTAPTVVEVAGSGIGS